MMTTLTIPQQLTFGEFYRFTLYYIFTGRRFKLYVLFIVGISLLSILLGLATRTEKLTMRMIISSVAPLIIMFLLLLLFVMAVCLFIYKTKPWLFTSVYEFTHWGVFRHGERTKFSKPWRDFSKFKESTSFFLLYVNQSDYHVIQKRLFKDEAAINDFREMLKANVSY